MAMIGAAVASVAGCFAYVAGWFSSHRLTQARPIDTFEEVNGVYSGFRRNHAKGVCIAGYFESNGQGARFPRPSSFSPAARPSSAVSRWPAGNLKCVGPPGMWTQERSHVSPPAYCAASRSAADRGCSPALTAAASAPASFIR
jgi:hypothetical protein